MDDPAKGWAPRWVRVLAEHRGRWLVDDPASGARLVAARARLRDADGVTPVAGDWVALDDGGAIHRVRERRGVITRRRAGRVTGGQVLAANVDVALIAEPLPDPNARRIERLVALAMAGDVTPVVVLTKADRAGSEDGHLTTRPANWPADVARGLAARLDGARVLTVSTVTGEGVDAIRGLLGVGVTGVVVGPSGAGKSTLVNALAGGERMRTGAVRSGDDRGRHTTVTRELVHLPSGASLIDTPGVREVGMWDGTDGTFTDIDALAVECRFADCAHDTEPGCAVRDAVDPARLEAWRVLQREQQWVDDRRAATREREARGRALERRLRGERRRGRR